MTVTTWGGFAGLLGDAVCKAGSALGERVDSCAVTGKHGIIVSRVTNNELIFLAAISVDNYQTPFGAY